MSNPQDDVQVRYLGDVLRLDLRPGDWLVIKLDKPITLQQRAELRSRLETAGFESSRNRVLILDSGMEIGVVSKLPECSEVVSLDVRTKEGG